MQYGVPRSEATELCLTFVLGSRARGMKAILLWPQCVRVSLHINAYLTDLTRFAQFNEVYVEFFGAGPPARTTVGADLLGILVEVDCVAVVRADG